MFISPKCLSSVFSILKYTVFYNFRSLFIRFIRAIFVYLVCSKGFLCFLNLKYVSKVYKFCMFLETIYIVV